MEKLTFPVQWYRNLFSIVDRIFSWVKYFKSWWRLITKTFTKLKCRLSWSILALYLSKSAWFKFSFFFFKSACSKKFPWTNLPFSTTVVEWTLPLSKGAMGHHQNTECKESHHCWELHPKSWYGLVLLVCFVISSKELSTKRPIYTSFIPWGAVGKKINPFCSSYKNAICSQIEKWNKGGFDKISYLARAWTPKHYRRCLFECIQCQFLNYSRECFSFFIVYFPWRVT